VIEGSLNNTARTTALCHHAFCYVRMMHITVRTQHLVWTTSHITCFDKNACVTQMTVKILMHQ